MMRKPQGYATVFQPDGAMKECDTLTCFHCQLIVHVPPRANPEDLGGLCKVCMQLICPRCVGIGSCTPWERKMEKIEARDRFLRSAGL